MFASLAVQGYKTRGMTGNQPFNFPYRMISGQHSAKENEDLNYIAANRMYYSIINML